MILTAVLQFFSRENRPRDSGVSSSLARLSFATSNTADPKICRPDWVRLSASFSVRCYTINFLLFKEKSERIFSHSAYATRDILVGNTRFGRFQSRVNCPSEYVWWSMHISQVNYRCESDWLNNQTLLLFSVILLLTRTSIISFRSFRVVFIVQLRDHGLDF